MPVRKCVNHIPPSPVKVNLEEESLMKQGIGTILRSDCDKNKAGSIRRTLSADMSSKKWLEQNGFLSPMKKTVSSEAIADPTDSSSEDEYEHEHIPDQDDVWRSIQARNQIQKPSGNQVWGSILLTQKSENSALPLPPPYVHPLVKRSASALTEKSLEICTEIFGSETGSDCFSSYSSDDDRQRVVAEELIKDSNPSPDFHVAKYRKSPAQPFPPPIPSISGASLHMQSRRENGRLVLQAVSVPPRNYFQAQRQDGRLRLTLIHTPAISSPEAQKVFDDMEEQLPEAEEKNLSPHSGVMKVDKSGLLMKKLGRNINPSWSNKNMDEESLPAPPQSLPPRVARFIPSAAPPAAASFNVYEYFWRSKTVLNPMITNRMNGTKGYENQDLVLMRANKTEQFGTYLKGCKEARRSLAIPDPSCWIATS